MQQMIAIATLQVAIAQAFGSKIQNHVPQKIRERRPPDRRIPDQADVAVNEYQKHCSDGNGGEIGDLSR